MAVTDETRDKFCFAIDRGGTFTDLYAKTPGNKIRILKLLSEDPANYADAPREGIRRIIEQETGVSTDPSKPVDSSNIAWIRMGTTVATNALLERKGERTALVINKGFRDLLAIGNQSRPRIFDLKIECPEMLYEEVVEVEERVILYREKEHVTRGTSSKALAEVVGSTGEKVLVFDDINRKQLADDLTKVLEKGIRSLAVVLMHSYVFQQHEQEIGKIARALGFTHVSLSSDVMPMIRIVPRGFTACADAYLTPHIHRYVQGFAAGFQKQLEGVNVLFMQSDGGLTPMTNFIGSRAILSGPAGGVVGYAMTTYQKETDLPVIGFDMGGTSTDVSRYAGSFEHVFESTTAGITVQAPQLDINTVAAGGGSQLFFRSGMYVVGPESAGAHPGPVCYRKGGPLTVTDANLCLGRILPEYFPHIFGSKKNEPLDADASHAEFNKLTEKVNSFNENQGGNQKKSVSVHEVAMGFIRVANEAMCRPIRALTQGKGYDTSRHCLACFGGAGGQHACSIARSLGMKVVFIHRYSGILSAYGMALADIVHEAQEPCAKVYDSENFTYFDNRIKTLVGQCEKALKAQGFRDDQIYCEPFLNMRYEKTDCMLMCSSLGHPHTQESCSYGDFKAAFLERYQREFGFVIGDRPIVIDDIRVRGVGRSHISDEDVLETGRRNPEPEKTVDCYFDDGWQPTNVHLLPNLGPGTNLRGPAIIVDKNSTIIVEPDCTADITAAGDIRIQIGDGNFQPIGPELDAVQLSIFSHRFMSLAEQMGRVLQRTAISTNIKERLDFSCALFGPDGGLVSNAPHIPVHLGAMQETVQYQMKALGNSIEEGDVILSNHPSAGGSHLPDLTVITPVFHKDAQRPIFFVASRGHHADIGGITPGSMPPHSKCLAEEGACFKSFKLVKAGLFQEEELVALLMEPGKHPGCSGSRNLQDNISDLRAQVAANQKGINLVKELVDFYGLPVVQAYMAHIQSNAEVAVRDMLREIAGKVLESTGASQLCAEDFMDDGSSIVLNVKINKDEGTAVFDFTGTGYEMHGNCNAPRAITLSAVIYCLRCMVGYDIPLNQGCLKPVCIVIPKGSLMDPSDGAAVVGGNVLTSQRIVDVIFKAFQVCAASQGCMNNITFGDDDSGYYETVAGGAGAGPKWHGHSGVHTHMTNTRITDPEILERRYPVIVNKFHLNPGTGGLGQFNGGDGVIRELLFRKKLTLSVLTERRAFAPYGLAGGHSGKRGLNLLYRKDGSIINLGGKTSVTVNAGDIFRLMTPGGGGYGLVTDATDQLVKAQPTCFEQHGSVFEFTRTQECA